jgi:hypothetical protein
MLALANEKRMRLVLARRLVASAEVLHPVYTTMHRLTLPSVVVDRGLMKSLESPSLPSLG